MLHVGYLTLATDRVWLILYQLRLSYMGSDVGQIFPTESQHRDHSILYALVCEKILSNIPVPTHVKDKNQTAAHRKTS